MSVKMQFRLLDLPNELVIHIVEHVDSLAVLRRLARLSRRMQELVEPVLYRQLLIRGPRGAKAILAAFKGRPQRAMAVQVLDVPHNPSIGPEIDVVKCLLIKMKCLKTLTIESPLVNEREFENKGVWTTMTDHLFRPFQAALIDSEPSSRPLQRLTSLTLHLNGPLSAYWPLDSRSVCIFQHPTLETAHISCMNLEAEVFDPIQHTFFTPLKHLILEECNINVWGLKSLLTLPAALETLYLGENCHNKSQFPGDRIDIRANSLFATMPDVAVAALKLQAHSLKSLTYATNPNIFWSSNLFNIARHTRDTGVVDGEFASFQALEKVHLIGSCRNFERALLCTRSPPNLRELIVESEQNGWLHNLDPGLEAVTTEHYMKDMSFLRVPSPCIPKSLKSITFTYDNDIVPFAETAERDTIDLLFEVYYSMEATFGITLSIKYKHRGRFFPPFLYGEPLPKETFLFNGLTGKADERFYDRRARRQNATAQTRFLEEDLDYEPSDDDEDGVWPVV